MRRNAYGRQLGSFAATADFGPLPVILPSVVAPGEHVPQDARPTSCSKDFPLVFIRGPSWPKSDRPPPSKRRWTANVVGLRQGKILATAFHPELTDDTRIHELFLSL